MRVLPVFAALAPFALAPAFAAQAVAADVTTITFHQEPPVLASLDLGAAGASQGDLLAFHAGLSGPGGVKATLYGLLVTIDTAEGSDKFEDRAGQVYVDFGNGSSIVIAGRSVYAGSEKEMARGVPQLRAVIGGTGDFIGARGQVSTVRNADNSYDHVITLLE